MSVAAFLWQGGLACALGGTCFVARAAPVPPALAHWARGVDRFVAAATAIAWGAGIAVLALEAARIVGRWPSPGAAEWHLLLTRTRFGQVWCLKQALLTVLCLLAWRAARGRAGRGGVMVLAASALLVGLWSGHGGATAPVALGLPLHAVHLLAAALWFGALPCWVSLVRAVPEDPAALRCVDRAIRRFSQAATVAMGVLVATGVIMAARQFERWPAVFGTPAGALLGGKLVLLGVALAMAWRLRRDFLARVAAPGAAEIRRTALRVIGVELLAATGVFALAVALARTTPGAHDPVTWVWPFRFAPGPAWTEASARWQTVAGVALALSALPAWRWRRPRNALALAGGGLAIACWAVAIPAFPDTYRRPDVPYTAAAIRAGATQFSTTCAGCHGPGARGDGPGAVPAGGAAADLSEHTALHTAGDMFWWLTHGTPTGNMPGFGAQLDDDARWSLVNFLRAFADGHRARVLSPRVVPRQPWLGAPNFTYETAGGRGGELKDARGTHAMLLVLAGGAPAASRLATLAGQHAALRTNGLRVLVIPTTITCADVPAPLDCITLGAVDTAFAYRLLARTLDAPGPRDALLPDVPHAEFLVDRFGFVRARWVPGADTEGWENPATLPAQARVLAREPQVLDSPDDHVH